MTAREIALQIILEDEDIYISLFRETITKNSAVKFAIKTFHQYFDHTVYIKILFLQLVHHAD